VRQRPGFAAIRAVQLNHIYPFNDTLVSRPGPRIVDGLEQLAHLLHPEVFG
jgi:iron complex transport system substrate-binding protein